MEKVKILLCEDDENLGMLLREYLQAKGFDVDLLPDGEAGYKSFVNGKYNLCILDVMMPKKDGFTLAQDIRKINGVVPIVFLTAKSLKEDVLEGFKMVLTIILQNHSVWKNYYSVSKLFCAV